MLTYYGLLLFCRITLVNLSCIIFRFCFSDTQSQGGIEDGEEPRTAAIRELREETGIESAEIIAEVCIEHWKNSITIMILAADVYNPIFSSVLNF